MSENELEVVDTGGALWDAPNQQVVRPDQSHPSEEGSGGEPGELVTTRETDQSQATGETSQLDSMTKDELIAYAQERGISPANAAMNKAELVASIEAAGG